MLDWLGDIGGLFDALRAIGTIIIAVHAVFRGNELEAFLLKSVYKKDLKLKYFDG